MRDLAARDFGEQYRRQPYPTGTLPPQRVSSCENSVTVVRDFHAQGAPP